MAPFDSGYSSTLKNKLSPLIEGQVPDFIQSDHAVFVRFLKHYYQYLESGELRLTVSIDNMLLEVQTDSFLLLEDGNKLVLESSVGKFSANETITGGTSKATATVLVDDLGNSTKPRLFISGQQQFQTGETITGGTSGATGTVDRYRGNPIQNLQQLLEYANTDNTIYDFLDQLRDSFMNAIPKDLATGVDQRNLIKNIRELYRAKGTSEGHKIFLRMLLGENSEIMYPNQFMMRVSDGNWSSLNIFRCSPGANAISSEMIGVLVTGRTSGATAVISSAIEISEASETVVQFGVSTVDGTFVNGEVIEGVSSVQDITMSFTIRNMVTSYSVTNGGKFYSVGDDLDVDTQTAIGNGTATAEVGSIKSGSVSRVIVDDAGSKYRVGETVTFTTEEGTTTSDPVVKEATGFISVVDGSLAIDGTDSSSSDADDNLILEDGTTSSFVSIGSIICEDATGTGTQFLILNRSTSTGSNEGARLSLGDQLTIDSHGTDSDTFALESGTIKSISSGANIGEITRVFIKDGGEGYSLLPQAAVSSTNTSLGSGAALLADSNDIGVVDEINIINQGFKYTAAPEGRFRANFLLKDVSGTFVFGNTLTTAGFTGTVQSFDTDTNILKTTFEDVERVTMETGDSNTIELETATEVTIDGRAVGFSLGDRPGETDFKIDNHLDGEGDLLLETGDSILMDATDEVGIVRFVAEDFLNNVFIIQENGIPDGSPNFNSRVDGPGNGFISEIVGNPNSLNPRSGKASRQLAGGQIPTIGVSEIFDARSPNIIGQGDIAITVNENDSLRTDNSLVLGALGDMRLLLEDATANVGDKLIGENTGNSIVLNGSDAASPQANILSRLLGDEEALSGNIEIDGTDSNSADAGDDIVFEDGIDFSSETLTITSSSGATGTIVSVDIAKGTSSIGVSAETTPSYSNIESLMGEALNRIQDSVYYQQFSYEVQTSAGQAEYLDELKKAVHPAGFNIFGKVSLATLVSAKLETTGASLGGGYTADTDTFSPILASTFEIIFQEQVSKEQKAITRPVAGYDDKLVLETDNPVGELALEAATVSSDETGRLITETETLFGDRVLLETSSPGNPLYLVLETGDRIAYESAVSVTFNLALEPPNTLNGGDFLPGGAIPATSTLVLEDSTANTGDKLELETGTPHCGRENSFFTFDVSRKDRVLDEDGANQYLETAGVGYRNRSGERGLVISRVNAKINLPNKDTKSIPNGAVFLGENFFDNSLGGLSLEIGTVGGSKSGVLLTNGTRQVNTKAGVDRTVPATFGDKFLLETKTDSNVGSGVTFRNFGEYGNDNIVLNGSDASGSNAGDNILLEAGTLTDSTHANKVPAMAATDVLIGETREFRAFHKMRDILRPPRFAVTKNNGEVVNLVSEESEVGTITFNSTQGDETAADYGTKDAGDHLLLEDGVGVGFNNRLSLEKQFLIPEDSTRNSSPSVIPTENFTNSDLEPLHYASDISKRPLGALSVESAGEAKVFIQLEDGTGETTDQRLGVLIADGTNAAGANANERLEMEVSSHQGRVEFGLGTGVFRFNKTRIDNIKLESSDGFLVADGTDGSSTNENERLHLEDSLCTNFEERLILESATIFDYVENTDAIIDITSVENSFDSSGIRFDSGLKTFDLNF